MVNSLQSNLNKKEDKEESISLFVQDKKILFFNSFSQKENKDVDLLPTIFCFSISFCR